MTTKPKVRWYIDIKPQSTKSKKIKPEVAIPKAKIIKSHAGRVKKPSLVLVEDETMEEGFRAVKPQPTIDEEMDETKHYIRRRINIACALTHPKTKNDYWKIVEQETDFILDWVTTTYRSSVIDEVMQTMLFIQHGIAPR